MSISRCRQQLTNPKSWARKLNNRLWRKDWAIFRSCFIAVRSRMFVCLLIAPTKVTQPAQKSLLTIKFQGTKKHQKLMSELYYWLFCYSLERWICVIVYNHFRLRTSLFMDSLRNTSLLFEGGLQRDMCSPKRLNTAGMAPTCDWMIKIVKINNLYLNAFLVSMIKRVSRSGTMKYSSSLWSSAWTD